MTYDLLVFRIRFLWPEVKEDGQSNHIRDGVGEEEGQESLLPHFLIEEVEEGAHEDANAKGYSQALIGMEGEADQQGEEEGPFLVFWLDSQTNP